MKEAKRQNVPNVLRRKHLIAISMFSCGRSTKLACSFSEDEIHVYYYEKGYRKSISTFGAAEVGARVRVSRKCTTGPRDVLIGVYLLSTTHTAYSLCLPANRGIEINGLCSFFDVLRSKQHSTWPKWGERGEGKEREREGRLDEKAKPKIKFRSAPRTKIIFGVSSQREARYL